MRYFVSIEKTPYFIWQIELLIESFKNFGLEKQLTIAIADSDAGGKHIPKNIAECDVILHENWTKNFNYKYVNKYLSLDLARRIRRIKPPFVVMESDMILLKPFEDKKEADIVVSEIQENNFNNFKNFNINFDEQKWTNTGNVFVVFKDSPIMYNNIANKCNELLNKDPNLAQKNWRIIDKISCNLTFQKYHLQVISKSNLESSLHEDKDSFVIHYNNSYNFFSKNDFNTKEEGVLDLNAYNKILTINPKISKNIDPIQENVKKLIKKLEVNV